MGSKDSTRWKKHRKKISAEQCLVLSMIDLMRAGFAPAREHCTAILGWRHPVTKHEQFSVKLTLNRDGDAPVLRLDYFVTRGAKEWREHEIVELVSTCMKYGGKRWYFSCPGCERRCIKLFVPPGDWNWACRHCHNLSYTSMQTAHEDDRGDSLKQFSVLRQRLQKLDGEINKCPRWGKRKRQLVTEYLETGEQLKQLMQEIGEQSAAMVRELPAIRAHLIRPGEPGAE